MIVAGDFRKGITFEMDGNVYVIVDFQHVKPGKGAAFVRTKIKNVVTGAVLEKTFNPSDKYERAHIESKEMEGFSSWTRSKKNAWKNTGKHCCNKTIKRWSYFKLYSNS